MTRRAGQRGSAYLLAVWGSLALAVVAMLVLSLATSTADRARLDRARALAEAAADGLVQRAVFALLDPAERGRLPRDGTPVEADHLGHRTRLSIQDVRGLADLNQAEPAFLAALFRQVGLAEGDAARAVEALVALRRPAEGRADKPAGLRHASVLAELPGVTAEQLKALLPLVTVHSGSATIDPFSAPAPVLAAATGAPAGEVQAFLLARRAGAAIIPPDSFRKGPLAVSDGQTFVLVAEVLDSDGAVIVRRRATVALAPGGGHPYRFLEYR